MAKMRHRTVPYRTVGASSALSETNIRYVRLQNWHVSMLSFVVLYTGTFQLTLLQI